VDPQHGRDAATTRGRSESDVLRRTLDGALRSLAELLAAHEAADSAEIIATLDRCRAQLAAGVDANLVDPIARSCFESARTVAAHGRDLATEQRAQIAGVVAMVRETLATIAGDQASLNETLAESAERFERLAQVTDLKEIQAQLVKEVSTLKRVTIERRAAWEQAAQEFGSRLNSLESQLDSTRREASLDPLTNVANRRTFERTCRDWLAPGRPGFVLAMCDVDDFKQINDRNGHAVGDRVLVTVAETLVRSLRGGDVVARLGGDEFAVLASTLTLKQAEGRLGIIGRSVQEACKALVQDGSAPSISIGVAECSAGDTLESLQQRADAALYEAKRNGKGRLAAKASPFIRDLRK
jgi:diguanylate cyclase (GGDEF)-like protein